ncbi:MAG TPA: DUF1573 domain-containing protein [Blastocatellia bacterium]|nr:DUF1573 domain-containing protein [Blastocatellia bacterium]
MKLIRTILISSLIAAFSISAAAGQIQASPQQNGGPNPSSSTAPVLVIESFTHDFGEVKPGTTLRYAFKVKNQGKADLQIQNVAPS